MPKQNTPAPLPVLVPEQPPATPAIMLMGTGSDVGKSLLVAGLCRAFAKRGLRVRPFKPQNMSNNAAVTPDGFEIGRAQAMQARACGVEPDVRMNPVLLKPQTDVGAQVVLEGRVIGNATASDYHALKPTLMPQVLASFDSLSDEADIVVIEGAGSAAEVNLRKSDIANWGFAEAADVPVVLVGDIDRGGVLAQLVGTHKLISKAERSRVVGYLVNKFRGDPGLFSTAFGIIRNHTGWPHLGLVPWYEQAGALPREDAMGLEVGYATRGGAIRVVVPRLSRIANFDDLDPLRAEPEVSVEIIGPGQPLPQDADIILIPGSKATLADLALIREQGWDLDIAVHVRRGGRVVGLCGGYQILGKTVADPDGIEGIAASAQGLGLLDVDTVLTPEKTLVRTSATCARTGQAVVGYEMHIGRTTGPDCQRPALRLEDGTGEGATSADGRVFGTYLHGLFAADGFRRSFLGLKRETAFEAGVEAALDGLADHLETHADLDGILAAARARKGVRA